MISADDLEKFISLLLSLNFIERIIPTKCSITKTGFEFYQSVKGEKIDLKNEVVFPEIYKILWNKWQSAKSKKLTISSIKRRRKIIQIIIDYKDGVSIDTISRKAGVEVSDARWVCDGFLKQGYITIKKTIGYEDGMYYITDKGRKASNDLKIFEKHVRKILKKIRTDQRDSGTDFDEINDFLDFNE